MTAEAKPEAPGGAAKSGTGPQAASRIGADDAITDGPILDMKAKRVPDPADKGPATGAKTSEGPTPKVGPVPAESPARSGYGALVTCGLIGGILGAGLFYLLAHAGATDSSRFDALDQTIATLAPRDAMSSLDKRVAANEQAVKPLPEAVKIASERANEALQKASATPAPSTSEGVTPAQGAPSDLVARLDALDQRISALQEEPGRDQPAGSSVAATRSGDDAMRLAALDERLKALETKGYPGTSVPVPATGLPPDLDQRFAAIQGDLDARAKVNASVRQTLTQRLDQLQETLDARVKSATEAVQTATEASRQAAEAGKAQAEETAKGVDRRLTEQGERIVALDKAMDGSAKAATVQAALRIVAADRIATALDAGTPYADALTSLRSSDPSAGAGLEPLAAFADTGAPTAASLAQSFRPIAEKIAAERRAAKARAVAETGSIADRLQNIASSIVQVKRVDPAAPSGAASAAAVPDEDSTATIQAALDHGRIADAAKAFAALPEDVRAKTGDFGTKLKARADADAAAQALQAQAFKSLSAPTAGP